MAYEFARIAWRAKLKPATKFVLVSLADQCNDEGYCWPSVAHLVRRTCLSERTIQACLLELEEESYITRHMRTGRSTYYQLHPREECTDPRSVCTPPPQSSHPTPATVAPIIFKEAFTESPSKHHGSSKSPKKGSKVTLTQYLSANPDANWGPEDGKARKHLRESKMPEEWFLLALRWFRDRYADSTDHKYINWPAAFANAVVDNWGKLWYFDQKTNDWALTSQGMAYKIKVDGANGG